MRSLLLVPFCLAALAGGAHAQTTVRVPHLVGLKAEHAKDNVEWVGFQFRVNPPGPSNDRVYNDLLDAGKIVNSQSLVGGTMADTTPPGAIISVVLVLPPEGGTLPKVTLGVNILILILVGILLRCCCRPRT